jgi:hypothetical protein
MDRSRRTMIFDTLPFMFRLLQADVRGVTILVR